MNKCYKHNGLEVKVGNLKLGDDTLIFNMGSSERCPSRKRGFCVVADKCYAAKAERLYKGVIPYRNRQEAYWKHTGVTQIITDFTEVLQSKRIKRDGELVPLHSVIKYLRINESGDFWLQRCVNKMDILGQALQKRFGIQTYGNTARKDLKFDHVRGFLIKGSSHGAGNNGRSIVRNIDKTLKHYKEGGRTYIVCPMDCRGCTYCKTSKKLNIVFPEH